MKIVTPEVVEQANVHAQMVVDEAAAKAKQQGEELSPLTAYYLHKAAWASVTGADQVQVQVNRSQM